MTMGEYETVAPQLEGEENLIAAAKHIVGARSSNKNRKSIMKKILADLRSQLSNMATIDDNMVEQLNVVQEKVLSWEADESMIWDSRPDKAAEYLNDADEARKLTEILESQCLNNEKDKEFLGRAHDVLQKAMLRLEKEFKHMLAQHRLPFEPELFSFLSSEDVSVAGSSMVSFGGSSIGRTSVDYVIDLVHPHVIPDLKSIANLMFMSKYYPECCQAFVIVRKDALDDCLFILEMENLSMQVSCFSFEVGFRN